MTRVAPEPFGEVPGWLCPVSQSLSSAEMVDIFMYLVYFHFVRQRMLRHGDSTPKRLFVIWKVGFVIGVVYLVFSISKLAGIS